MRSLEEMNDLNQKTYQTVISPTSNGKLPPEDIKSYTEVKKPLDPKKVENQQPNKIEDNKIEDNKINEKSISIKGKNVADSRHDSIFNPVTTIVKRKPKAVKSGQSMVAQPNANLRQTVIVQNNAPIVGKGVQIEPDSYKQVSINLQGAPQKVLLPSDITEAEVRFNICYYPSEGGYVPNNYQSKKINLNAPTVIMKPFVAGSNVGSGKSLSKK